MTQNPLELTSRDDDKTITQTGVDITVYSEGWEVGPGKRWWGV